MDCCYEQKTHNLETPHVTPDFQIELNIGQVTSWLQGARECWNKTNSVAVWPFSLLGKEVQEPGPEALPRSLVAAEEMMRLADRAGDLFGVYPWGSWISQPGKNSALWFRGVVGSAVIIRFLSVPEEEELCWCIMDITSKDKYCKAEKNLTFKIILYTDITCFCD